MDQEEVNYRDSERYLYTVLNLPKDATHADINERHKSLSLIFHPDKQVDPNSKASATKEFLEIQKAYQVLSDPFLRLVYDTLGAEGLKISWPPNLRKQSKSEIPDILRQTSVNLETRKQRALIAPKGSVSCSFDASSLVSAISSGPTINRLQNGLSQSQVIAQSISYSVEKTVSKTTALSFEAKSQLQGRQASLRFSGTVRHQFSPRLTAITSIQVSRPYFTKLDISYDDGSNAIELKTALTPLALLSTPTLAASYSRRLFRNVPHRGKVALQISRQPSIAFFYISPPVLRLRKEEEEDSPRLGPPSVSGFKFIAFDRNIGVVFTSFLPKLIAETSVHLVELSTRFKASIEYSLTGVLATLGVYWSGQDADASTSLVLNGGYIIWETSFSYLDIHFSMPVILSTTFNPRLALGTVVMPSAFLALSYHLFILPRRRARRLAHLRAARQTFEEDSDSRKERSAVENLLKDAVKKQLRLENDREGLIIQEATYSSNETNEGEGNILLNVTTPLQALVRNSQLHIPGGDTKAALQGFSDPAPFSPKSLRVRYLFRGRLHYAEIPDHLPVVLPLAEHLVNDSVNQ
ncbi:hypothetical protein CPB83DRAFT_863103 [Crepidotus variabilis]|uniref:J domain-containing protein n=1 Tax=Crepidotus variabilis TaxID=179855 RepID=A0A9P6JJX2_9AGAR|nr:hypothetical protein CPB83DRAFT_863103 [Crepidotus variabilis]